MAWDMLEKYVHVSVVCATLITAYMCAGACASVCVCVCVCVCAVCSVSAEIQQRLVSRKKSAVKGSLFVIVCFQFLFIHLKKKMLSCQLPLPPSLHVQSISDTKAQGFQLKRSLC